MSEMKSVIHDTLRLGIAAVIDAWKASYKHIDFDTIADIVKNFIDDELQKAKCPDVRAQATKSRHATSQRQQNNKMPEIQSPADAIQNILLKDYSGNKCLDSISKLSSSIVNTRQKTEPVAHSREASDNSSSQELSGRNSSQSKQMTESSGSQSSNSENKSVYNSPDMNSSDRVKSMAITQQKTFTFEKELISPVKYNPPVQIYENDSLNDSIIQDYENIEDKNPPKHVEHTQNPQNESKVSKEPEEKSCQTQINKYKRITQSDIGIL